MKKGFVVLTAVFAVLALAGYAFAVNTATINVTSEPIRNDAKCDKAGGFSITFDKTTLLADGDQITADLDLYTYLCRNIDIVIAATAGADLENVTDVEIGVGWNPGNTPAQGAPVTKNDGGDTISPAPVAYCAGDNTFCSSGSGVYFYIHGTDSRKFDATTGKASSGSGRITIDIIGENPGANFRVGGDDEDSLSLQFLDQKTNIDFLTQDGIWVDRDNDGDYDVAAAVADNTLCIDVSDDKFTESTVDANCDSKSDKFTFIPSDPQVAHIVAQTELEIVQCTKPLCGKIKIGSRSGTQGSTTADCTAFDNESGLGYCTGSHANHDLIIYNQSGAFEQTNYQLVLQLFKNDAQTVSQGVYWSTGYVLADGYASKMCATFPTAQVGGVYGYTNWEGKTVNNGVEAANNNDCDVADTNHAVNLTTDASGLGLGVSDRYLKIDLPSINYDIDQIKIGDTVKVKITILRAPCGVLFEGEYCLGTFGCEATTQTTSGSLTFPYFTQMKAEEGVDNFWDGIVIVNLTDTAGEATLTVYEQDGDTASGKVSVAKRSMYVNTLGAMLDAGLIKSADSTATLGNARCYVTVTTNFTTAGFAMMGDASKGESMGYLPFPYQTK